MKKIDYLISGNHNIPIAFISPKQFANHFPRAIQKDRNGALCHDSSKINLFFDSFKIGKFANSVANCWEVNSMEDFAFAKRQILTNPSFLYVEIKVQYTEYYVFVRRHVTITKPVILYISPTHPVISAQLKPQFEECEKQLQEGKRFSLEIRLEDLLKKWYDSFPHEEPFCPIYYSFNAYGSTICITNFSQRCNMCYNPCWWICPPTWVLGPPYLLYRSLMSQDYQCDIDAFGTKFEDIRITGRAIQSPPQSLPFNQQFTIPAPQMAVLTPPQSSFSTQQNVLPVQPTIAIAPNISRQEDNAEQDNSNYDATSDGAALVKI